VGDSRLYLSRQGRVYQLSEDHTFVQEAVRRGMLTPEQAKDNPHQNLVTRAVGPKPSVLVDSLVFDVLPGDSLLLCSDGLHGYFEDTSELGATLGLESLESVAKGLIDTANQRGGEDNITTVVLRLSSDPPDQVVEAKRASRVTAELDAIGHVVLFSELDMKELVKVANAFDHKDYGVDEVVVHEGDVSETLFVIVSGAAKVTIGNQRGGGLRMDYAFLPGPWSFSVNSVAYGFNEETHLDAWDGIFVTHSWVGLKKRQEYGEGLQYSLDFTLGTRFEVLLHDIPATDFMAGDMDRWMIHGRGEVTLADGDHSLDVVVDHRHERELLGNSVHEFQIGGVAATYSFGVPFTITLAFRWTDFQQGVVQRRAEVDYNFLGGEFYPSLEARYTFEPGTYLGLFMGQTPGGQICSGGVCRDVPTFEGIRLSFVGRL